jgi:hypothetical protein
MANLRQSNQFEVVFLYQNSTYRSTPRRLKSIEKNAAIPAQMEKSAKLRSTAE